jgi:hypothetical protein
MTQSHSAEKTADRCAGELLWNVSLLPVSRPPKGAPSQPAPVAVIVELPRDLTIQEAIRRRNAA